MAANILIFFGGWILGFLIIGGTAFRLNNDLSIYFLRLLAGIIFMSWTMLYFGVMFKVL